MFFPLKMVALECCEKTVWLVLKITYVIISGQMHREYKIEAAERKLRVEQEKRDEQIEKKGHVCWHVGLRQAWFLTLNIRTKKPSLDKNECGKTNEAKITSKSSYQISVGASESLANPNLSRPPTTFKWFVADEYWEQTLMETILWQADTWICLEKSTKSTVLVWVSNMVGKLNFFAFLSLW